MRTKVPPVKEGDTWKLEIQVLDGAGAPYDFTGLTATMNVVHYPSRALLVALTEASGLVLDTPSPGYITVSVPSTASAGMCDGKTNEIAYADLKLSTADLVPVVTTIVSLEFTVEPGD